MLKKINKTRHNGWILLVTLFTACKPQSSNLEAKLNYDSSSRVIGATIAGKKEGLWITYNDSGRVFFYSIYINDSLQGETIGFFENGIISFKGLYKNGERDGEWVMYYDQEKIAEKGRYKEGKKIGIWEYYIIEGKLDKKLEHFEDGTQKIIEDHHLTPPVPENFPKISTKLNESPPSRPPSINQK